LAYPDAWIDAFGPEGLQRIAYEETEHFQITRNFMPDHHRMLKRLNSISGPDAVW
jgi:predicted ATPase